MPRRADTPDCGIKGCARAVYKGALCRGHYALVPHAMVMALTMGCFNAQFRAASKHYKRQLTFVKAKIRAGEAV